MLQDGFSNHPRVHKTDFQTVFSRWGKWLLQATPVNEMLDRLTQYDLIFINSEMITQEREQLFDSLKLWDRVVVIDCKDDQNLRKEYIYKCLVYFKRSWEQEKGQWTPPDAKNVLPLAYAILDEYYDVIPYEFYAAQDHRVFSPLGRDIAVLCTLPQAYRGVPRDELVHAVKNYDWGMTTVKHGHHCSQLTLVYTSGWLYSSCAVLFRQPRTFAEPHINWWYLYMHFMHRAQIIFTAASHSAACDVRTWEAFSSGGLVAIDRVDVPMPHPFEPGTHYLEIDNKNLPKTFERAKELLSDNTERERMALAGYEHGKRYHTTRARMDYIFEEIDKRKTWA